MKRAKIYCFQLDRLLSERIRIKEYVLLVYLCTRYYTLLAISWDRML